VIFSMTLSSCGDRETQSLKKRHLGEMRYGKVLKNNDIDLKFDHAVKYYEEGECYKALPIFDELFGLVRGTGLYEDVYYYYAKTNFCIGDYYLSNYYCKNFSKTFSSSARAEELLFLSAMSSYQNSPDFSLDQGSSKDALNEFQYFLDSYPNSSLKDSCENMMDRLNYKLEKKEVEIARLYVNTGKYKSGTIAVQRVLDNYPESQFREELYYLKIKTWHEYARSSVEHKKVERYRVCLKSYTTFVTVFPESSYRKLADELYNNAYNEVAKRTEETEVNN